MSPHCDGPFVWLVGQWSIWLALYYTSLISMLLLVFKPLFVCCQSPGQTGNFQKVRVALYSLMQELSSSVLEPASTSQKDCFEHPRMEPPDFFFLLKIHVSNAYLASWSVLNKINCTKLFAHWRLSQKWIFGMLEPLLLLLFLEAVWFKGKSTGLGFVSPNFLGLCFLTYKTGMIMHAPTYRRAW